jgi:hypothetical protein
MITLCYQPYTINSLSCNTIAHAIFLNLVIKEDILDLIYSVNNA